MEDLAGPIYVDTSALVKLYLHEAGSEELGNRLTGRRDLLVSQLSVTEFASAIGRRKRENELSEEDSATLYAALLRHLEGGYFLHANATADTYRSAERILLTIEGVSLRAADAIHLAMALTAGAQTLATSDVRMQTAAGRLGLAVLPA